MPRRLLRRSQVEDRTGLKKTQLYQAMSEGRFPRPVPILEGGAAVGWLEDEIEAFIEARIAARDGNRKPGRPRKVEADASTEV
jgi:prophage regulatory protein